MPDVGPSSRERLEQVQDAIRRALDADPTDLVDLLESRESDLRALADALRGGDDDPWARDYLDRDRALLQEVLLRRDAVGRELSGLHSRVTAQRRYLSTGVRR